MEKAGVSKQDESVPVDASSQKISLAGASDNVDQLHRRLGNRQIQLSAIGSSVGTGIFMVIGGALSTGGPIGLLISWSMYASVMGMVNSCVAEMVTFMPVSGGFIRLAGHWVDDAFGFAAGWVFWFYLVLEIPFEITAISVLLKYWRDDIPVAAVCGACIASIA
jgi:amino acid transporter